MHSNKQFEQIFHEYYGPLCNYAAKIVKDGNDAEEIVQNLFVQLLEKRSLDNVEQVDRFLIRSVKFKCIDHLRKQQNSNRVAFDHLVDTDVIDHIIDSEEEMAALFDYMVARLPPKTREVFLLVRVSQLSYKAAAAHLNISEKTVENQMGRALKKMRINLKDAGYLCWFCFSIYLK